MTTDDETPGKSLQVEFTEEHEKVFEVIDALERAYDALKDNPPLWAPIRDAIYNAKRDAERMLGYVLLRDARELKKEFHDLDLHGLDLKH